MSIVANAISRDSIVLSIPSTSTVIVGCLTVSLLLGTTVASTDLHEPRSVITAVVHGRIVTLTIGPKSAVDGSVTAPLVTLPLIFDGISALLLRNDRLLSVTSPTVGNNIVRTPLVVLTLSVVLDNSGILLADPNN